MFRKNNKNPHFLQKLANREITGNFIRQGKANSQNSSASKLFKTIPSRCVYQLNNVIDLPGNHVFMGTTRCGQFLLTYSFITHTARSTLSQRNKYQLHWWLFRPGRRAAKVAEVQLFADYAVTSILTIGIAQWPTVNQRLVVYGYCNNAEDYLEEDHRRYYLTITTLPSLDCRDCLTVAASFDEEDMAANWDSCVSFSCLKHGLTIHSLFDVTPPYPKFDFNISLKLNNSVVFNTVNFLHVLSFDFENPKPDRPTKNEQNIVTAEINHRVGHIMTTRYPKVYALPYDMNEAFKSANPVAKHVMKPLLLPPPTSQPQRTSSIFHSKEKSSRQWCNRIPNLAMKPVPIRTKVWRRSIIDQAEKVYAFEESEDGGCEPKFKWYRRKRLADKMYEFCSDEDDEDMENIRPPDKCGHKLPRYKYLPPAKVTVTPPKCDVDSATAFTKMIRKNDARMIQNADCCKRLIQNNWKTDETRHDNNELNNSSDSLKTNSCSVDENCCDIQHRDMVAPQIHPKLNTVIEIGNLVEPCSDNQQQDSLKSIPTIDEISCDMRLQDMVKPITIQSPPNNSLEIDNPSKLVNTSGDEQQEEMVSLKTITTSDNTSCDIRHRDMDKPMTIQIPPIDLPFCTTSEDKQEPLLKEPELLLKEPELLLKEPEPLLMEPEPLLKEPEPLFLSPATVSVRRVRSDINNCDNRQALSPPDTQSNHSSVTFDQVDNVTNTLGSVNSAKDAVLVDILSSGKIDNMETVGNDNEKIVATVFSVSNPRSEINSSENVCCTSNDTVSNPSSTNVCNSPKNSVSNTSSMNTDICISSKDCESNTSSTNLEFSNSPEDSVSNSSSTNPDVCNSCKDSVSNSSPLNTDTNSNDSPINIDIVSSSTIKTVPNSSSRYTSRESVSSSNIVCNTPSDSVSNVKATFETNPRESVSSSATICNSPSDTVSNVKTTCETNPRYASRESVSSSNTVCNTPSATVSNLKATFETSNINHDVRAIIADWEADSISSMSPQSEFSSSVTTCNSPKVLDYILELAGDNCTERHMVIQRFLEIPPRFGCGAARKNCSQHINHHRCPNITSNELGMKVLHHSNVTRCFPMRSSSTQYPPIKLRALQPHNRIRRSCFKPDYLLSPPLCVRYEKEEELKRKKIVGSVVGANKNEVGERRGFKHDLLLSPPLRYDKEEEVKRKKVLGGGKPEGDRRKIPNYSEIVGDGFEGKRKREKVASFSGGEVTDVKRKKKDETGSFEDDLADILDNIVDRRKISDCSIQLDRRFIEVDEEMISTITDIEDDDQAVGFHCALPLHVHGSAYAQMQMVSNQKVDKLNVPCVLVRQNSLDIEQLCFKAAEVICRCEGFKFWFCDDYDTEIVEVCPLDGSVLIVIFMRLNVEQENVCSKPVVVDRRHFYECKCLFVWSPGRQECLLETFTHLRPVPHDRDQVDGWSPARKEAQRMRARAETGFFHLQPAPAIRAFVHRLYDDDDNQTDSALEVQDPTNLMLFRLYPVNSNMRINRNRIVVL